MKTFANMKCQLVKISWGIVEIGNTRVYAELWLSVERMNLKVKFKVPKGVSYSYACSAKDAPFEDGQFLSYWIPKNIYFPVHFCSTTVNELVDAVVKHLQLKFFKESRKWLTKDEKTTAGRYQVNVSESVDGDVTPWISEWSEDGYVGTLMDTQYMDGCDTTNWCVFVGTHSECEAYIRKHVNY